MMHPPAEFDRLPLVFCRDFATGVSSEHFFEKVPVDFRDFCKNVKNDSNFEFSFGQNLEAFDF